MFELNNDIKFKAKYQPLIAFHISLCWCFRRLHICRKAASKQIIKLNEVKIQILLWVQSSPNVEEAQKIRWKESKERRTFVYSRSSSGTFYPVLCNESISFPWSKAKPLSWATDGSAVAHVCEHAHLAPRCWSSVCQRAYREARILGRVLPGPHSLLPHYCLHQLAVVSFLSTV